MTVYAPRRELICQGRRSSERSSQDARVVPDRTSRSPPAVRFYEAAGRSILKKRRSKLCAPPNRSLCAFDGRRLSSGEAAVRRVSRAAGGKSRRARSSTPRANTALTAVAPSRHRGRVETSREGRFARGRSFARSGRGAGILPLRLGEEGAREASARDLSRALHLGRVDSRGRVSDERRCILRGVSNPQPSPSSRDPSPPEAPWATPPWRTA